MTPWEEIEKTFADADVIEKLTRLYMERGDVTWAEAREWALAKYREHA